MPECGPKSEKLDSSGAHVVQLRRLVWLLLVWSTFLTMGLTVSISLHFILTTETDHNNHPKLFIYDYEDSIKNSSDGSIELRWQNNSKKNFSVEVQEDGRYFLYLQVSLEQRKPNVTYAVTVNKESDQKSSEKILEGHINGSQLSTGFMGKGFLLEEGTILKVTCDSLAKVDYQNTYLGIIKLS